MSIKKIAFETVVIIAFLMGTGFVFNYILGTSLSNPLVTNNVTAEEQV